MPMTVHKHTLRLQRSGLVICHLNGTYTPETLQSLPLTLHSPKIGNKKHITTAFRFVN